MNFLKVRRVDGSSFVFNMKTESSFELEECFVNSKEWRLGKEKKVFVYKNKLITSYRIGPLDRSELVVIE